MAVDGDNPYVVTREWKDPEQLERAYWDYYWSTIEIGQWVGEDGGTIDFWMEELGIPRRTNSESQHVKWMKRRGATLESISEKIPHPESKHGERVAESRDLTWGDVDGR